MTQEEKQILLVDLCGRLPYRVKIKFAFNKDIESAKNLIYVSYNGPSYIHNSCMTLTEDNIKYVFNGWLNEYKPYLHPMSSMTDEELKEFAYTILQQPDLDAVRNWQTISIDLKELTKALDWLNKNMFDYRDLIEKGLALEAPKDMYETE